MDAPCAWTVASGVELAAMIAVPLTKAAISGLPEVWYQVVTCAPQVPVPAAVLAGADVVLSDARVVLVLSGTDVMLVLAGTDVVLVLSATDVVLAGADVVLAAGVLTAALLAPQAAAPRTTTSVPATARFLMAYSHFRDDDRGCNTQPLGAVLLEVQTSVSYFSIPSVGGNAGDAPMREASWSRRCQTQWPHTLPPPPVLQHRRCRVPGQR